MIFDQRIILLDYIRFDSGLELHNVGLRLEP